MVEGPGLDKVPEWVPLQEAARIAGVSEKTLRRRIGAGTIDHRMEGNRYLVRTASILPERSEGRELVPMAVLEALERLRSELQAEAVARAKAETIATFQTERAGQEIERRQQAEALAESLQAKLAELQSRRWWQSRKRP